MILFSIKLALAESSRDPLPTAPVSGCPTGCVAGRKFQPGQVQLWPVVARVRRSGDVFPFA